MPTVKEGARTPGALKAPIPRSEPRDLLPPRPGLRPLPGRPAARVPRRIPVPLEPPHEPIEGDGLADLLPPLVEFADSLGSRSASSRSPAPPPATTNRRPAAIVIEVASEFSANAQVSTLIHELAHALVRIDRQHDDPEA